MPVEELDPEREAAVQIVAQFVTLVHSRLKDDFTQAADAKRALEARGVTVRFRRLIGKAVRHAK